MKCRTGADGQQGKLNTQDNFFSFADNSSLTIASEVVLAVIDIIYWDMEVKFGQNLISSQWFWENIDKVKDSIVSSDNNITVSAHNQL